MARQSRAERRKAWLNRQAQLQHDGSFLIRPFGRIPIVYQVDADTKDRWVKFRLASGRLSLIALVVFSLFQGEEWSWTVVFCAIMLAIGFGGPLIVLRRSRRVPRSRWIGPAVIDPDGWYSGKVYLIWMIVTLLMGSGFAYVGWFEIRGDESPWKVLPAILLMAALAAAFAFRLRRMARNAS